MKDYFFIGGRGGGKTAFITEFVKSMQAKLTEDMKERICLGYCKYPDEYRSFYKDIDEAEENMMREKCEMCPLNNLID